MPPKRTPPNRPKSGKGKPKKQPKTKGALKKQVVDQVAIDHEAFELRRDGASFPEIAMFMECSVSTAKDRVTRRVRDLKKYTEETIYEIKTMEDHRLLRTQLELSAIVKHGTNSEKIRAAMAQVAIGARRAALLGLDSSAKLDVNISNAGKRDIDAEIQRVLDSVEAATAAGEVPAALEITGTAEPVPTNGNELADLDGDGRQRLREDSERG